MGGDSELKENEEIIIRIQDIKFQIIFLEHETNRDQYLSNVTRFLQMNVDGDLPIGGLGLQSTVTTVEQSGALSPYSKIQPPIYIDREKLGSGAFSIVSRVWNVSTGSIYASKKIINMEEFQWKKDSFCRKRLLTLC